ncbi:MAG: hypothetical protein HQK52_12875 [Oligoflexia bacterium]|nr:hypothetical protein [Oligoflexia bacterium]
MHGRVEGFKNSARDIDYDLRLKLSSIKCEPVNEKLVQHELGDIDLKKISL